MATYYTNTVFLQNLPIWGDLGLENLATLVLIAGNGIPLLSNLYHA
jgi:hypothetical protein